MRLSERGDGGHEDDQVGQSDWSVAQQILQIRERAF